MLRFDRLANPLKNRVADSQSFLCSGRDAVHSRISDGFCVQIELPVRPDTQVFVCAGETAWFIHLEDLDVFLQG